MTGEHIFFIVVGTFGFILNVVTFFVMRTEKIKYGKITNYAIISATCKIMMLLGWAAAISLIFAKA